MKVKSIVLILIFVCYVMGLCPNSCNQHGTCNRNNICECYTDYTGSDCSIYERVLKNNEYLSGRVGVWDWHYFRFQTGFGAGNLNFQLLSDDPNGDCDLYIKLNERPSRLNYDYKDTNPSTDSTIHVNNTAAGTYYAGVFGFYGGSYKIRVQVLGSCEVPCVHGRCQNGACICDQGYSGPSCNSSYRIMDLNVQYAADVAKDDWVMYNLNVNSRYSSIDVILTQTGSNADADCDLYAKFDSPPTRFNWDYFDQNWKENVSKVSLIDPQQGHWYIGVYGFERCSFSIKATPSADQCTNKCTKRGNCVNHICQCNSDYIGTYCEDKITSLNNNEVVNGYVEFLAWNYYKFNTSSQNSLYIQVDQTNETSDCDIYIKFNDYPTATLFDYFDISYLKNFNVTITDAGIGTWYIGIYGVSVEKPCDYSMSVRVSSTCSSCVHGTCYEGGYCFCQEGWAGNACDIRVDKITENRAVAGTVERGSWKYYSFETNGTTAYVVLKEKSTQGLAWLFANLFFPPDLRYHEYSDVDTKKSFHSIELKFEAFWTYQKNVTIGIYGSPYSSRPIEYDIVAWSTPF